MLYFIRHGQTQHNVDGVLTGRLDIPLNENGLKQVEKEAIESKKINIDIIFCSPLLRTKQTCEAINKYHNSPVIITEEIIEHINYAKQKGCKIIGGQGEITRITVVK